MAARGQPSDHPLRYPYAFRYYTLGAIGAIAIWLVAGVAYVLPVLRETCHGPNSSGKSRLFVLYVELHLWSLLCVALTRAMYFLPCMTRRISWLHSCRLEIVIFRDGQVLFFMFFTGNAAWHAFTYEFCNAHKDDLAAVFVVLQIHCFAISVLVLTIAVWHGWLMYGFAEPEQEPVQAHNTLQDIVDRFESYAYDEHIFGREEGRHYPGECAICLGDWERSDRIKVTPCQHAFHEDCLVSWLRTASTCALCRQDLYTLVEECSSLASSMGWV